MLTIVRRAVMIAGAAAALSPANHSMFWPVMGGKGGEPEGELAAAVTRDFGSFAAMKESLARRAAGSSAPWWNVLSWPAIGERLKAARPGGLSV